MQFETWLKPADLKKKLAEVENLSGVMFSHDLRGNKIGVEVYSGGEAVPMTGHTIIGYVIKADGETITITGSGTGKEGNKAWIILPENAYNCPGPIDIVIRARSGSGDAQELTTIGACRGYVQRSRTDTIIAGDYEILDVDTLLEMIGEMETATAAANTAASAANTAAEKLEGMDATAASQAAGTAPTAAVTTVSGHYRLSLGIPKGDTGEPARVASATTSYGISDDIQTMPEVWAGEIPTVPQGKFLWIRRILLWNNGGTTNLYTISRQGMDGSGSVSTVNGISPDSNHNVELPVTSAAGTISDGTSCAANTTTDLTVSFGKTLAAVPVVVASISQNSSTTGLHINRVTNITATGCTIQLYNTSGTARELSGNRVINWVAVCP